MTKAPVRLIFSGGLDSTVLLYWLRARGYRVTTVSFDYGQRHVREVAAARDIAAKVKVPHEVVSLPPIVPARARPAIPDGRYDEPSMRATISPNRNMLFLAYAVGQAIYHGEAAVAYAAHGGDHAIYPDCRPAFVYAMRAAVAVGNWETVRVFAPFTELAKVDLVRLGAKYRVPFGMTWSCYRGGERHCGTCGTCTERREAFQQAGILDPTEYAIQGGAPCS